MFIHRIKRWWRQFYQLTPGRQAALSLWNATPPGPKRKQRWNAGTMNTPVAQPNLVLAWLWIMMGFGSGFWLGLNFHQEHWLGGYASHKRRLYRLGHISFFGLALMNLMFYFTA